MKSLVPFMSESCDADGGVCTAGRRTRERRDAAMTRAWRKFWMWSKVGAVKRNGGGRVFE